MKWVFAKKGTAGLRPILLPGTPYELWPVLALIIYSFRPMASREVASVFLSMEEYKTALVVASIDVEFVRAPTSR